MASFPTSSQLEETVWPDQRNAMCRRVVINGGTHATPVAIVSTGQVQVMTLIAKTDARKLPLKTNMACGTCSALLRALRRASPVIINHPFDGSFKSNDNRAF